MANQPLSKLAGMLCGNPRFQAFIGATCAESAAAFVRRHLVGAALVETPSAYPRALDIVNRARTFLPVRDGDRVHLVHRAHIRTIHPGD